MKKFLKVKFLILIAFLLGLYCTINAGENPHNTLWRISSEKNSVYLLGSIHLLKNNFDFLNDSIKQAFDDSQIVVFEVDPNRMADPRAQQMMLTKGMLAEGKSLDKKINKGTYELARKKAAELGLDISLFKQFKPWFFTMTLAVAKMQQLGFSTENGLDKQFFAKATRSGKQVLGLETVEYQLAMLDTLSEVNQDELVRQTIKELDILEDELDKILTAWSTGDMKLLESTILKSFEEYPEVYNVLIRQRNKNWIPKIESFLKQKDNYMVIVGAAHLAGSDGLVALMKKKGYHIDQL